MESLESRELLAARVFVDFGDSFSSGVLNTTAANWVSTAKGVDFSAAATNISIQRFNNIAAISSLGATAISTIRSELLTQVAKYFEPFDVVVQTASATSVTDIANTLNSTDGSGDNDSYIVLGRYYNTSTGAALRSSGILGQAAGLDLASQTNSTEETASVFADNIMTWIGSGFSNTQIANAFSFIVAHEAGHTFGLRHTANSPTPGSTSDIMTQNPTLTQAIRTDSFFSAVYMNNDIGGTYVPFDKLTTNVGPKLNNTLYATGSGGNDTITVSYTGTKIRVEVAANPDSGSLGTISEWNYYTGVGPYLPITVSISGGLANDRIVFDSSLANLTAAPVIFFIDGGSSDDYVESYGTNNSDTQNFVPATSTTNGTFYNLSFNSSTENVTYFSNGGNDVVNAQLGSFTQLTVRNNTGTGNVYAVVNGTSGADTVTFVPAPVSGLGSLTVGSNLPVIFNDKVFAVEYYTSGGDDDILAYSGTTNEFTAIKTSTGNPLLAVLGTGGADVVTMQGQVGATPGYISFNGGGPKNVKFTGIEYVAYDTNSGSDVIYASNTNNQYFGVRKSGTGSVVLATYGTTSADVVTMTGQTSTVAGSVSFASGSKPVSFFGVDQVNYNTQGGADVVYAANSTYQTFQVAKSGANPGSVTLATYGTTGADTTVMTGQVSTTPGSVVFTGGTSKPVYFLDVDQVNYSTSGGSDVVHTANNTKQVFHVSKTGANPGTVTVATYGTTGADSVYIAGQVGSTAGFVQFGGTSKSVYFVGVDQVNYSSQGGNDTVTVVPGLVQEFSILKTGASGNVTVATSGTSSNDHAYIVGTATGYVQMVFSGVTQKKINLYSISQINYATQGGSDTIHYTHGVSTVYVFNPGLNLVPGISNDYNY